MSNTIEVGDVFHGRQSYGGSGHSLGFFRVSAVGKMFVSLRGIECEAVGEKQEESDPAYYGSYQQRKAKQPFVDDGQKAKFSLASYDMESRTGYVETASMCSRNYTKVIPNEQGEYVYEHTSVSYQ